ncbi:preprotein translocase subunit YajC [Vagococcus entomophilus]|uniref:Preprotein translocase subunit YajC n=1 Tax=Vagococcus entomophilus TaxID=1160095 RepID=A0A430AGI7_9ENTE|nr:preprotein translocase subunit YajC [Vagococcus entomophilus]RSU07039.1 preprotein translocase subunit YajC [Vagococcus entomophilus]
MQFIILIGAMAVMLFFMTRTQKKQQQKRQELLSNAKVGSKVVTIGGLHGVISEINEEKKTVTLDCEGIYLEFNRSAIATVEPSVEVPTVEQETTTTTEVNETVEEKE